MIIAERLRAEQTGSHLGHASSVGRRLSIPSKHYCRHLAWGEHGVLLCEVIPSLGSLVSFCPFSGSLEGVEKLLVHILFSSVFVFLRRRNRPAFHFPWLQQYKVSMATDSVDTQSHLLSPTQNSREVLMASHLSSPSLSAPFLVGLLQRPSELGQRATFRVIWESLRFCPQSQLSPVRAEMVYQPPISLWGKLEVSSPYPFRFLVV